MFIFSFIVIILNLLFRNVIVWRQIVEPNIGGECNQEWLNSRISDIGLENTPYNDAWGYDQSITTFGILKHRLCTVPRVSGLWKIPGLSENKIYFPEMDDSNICWHGSHYEDCNYERPIVSSGCKWWHFYPHHKLDIHVNKFRDLTNNSFTKKISELYFNLRKINT